MNFQTLDLDQIGATQFVPIGKTLISDKVNHVFRRYIKEYKS